jgi:hypothetical protein
MEQLTAYRAPPTRMTRTRVPIGLSSGVAGMEEKRLLGAAR